MITSKHFENLFSLSLKCSKFPCLPCHLSLVMVFDRDGVVLRFSTGQRSSILAALRSCGTRLGYKMPNTLALEELHDIWNNDFKDKDLALVESIKHSSIHPEQFGFRSDSPGIFTWWPMTKKKTANIHVFNSVLDGIFGIDRLIVNKQGWNHRVGG